MSDQDIPEETGAPRAEEKWFWVGLGLALVTGATIAFEVVLTRIFSVVLWYHYGFMSISLALLGIGLAGVYVYLFPDRFRREKAVKATATASLLFAVTACLALLVFHWIVSEESHWRTAEIGSVSLSFAWRTGIFVITVVPLFFAGMAVAIPLSRFTEKIGVLYSADLLGAAVGAVLVIPLIAWLGGHAALIACAAIACLSALSFARAAGDRKLVVLGALALVGCVVGADAAVRTDYFRFRFVKRGRSQDDVIAERWNSFSRVAVAEARPPAIHRRITIDGGAATPMIPFQGDFAQLGDLGNQVQALVYHLRKYPSALIIGAGGGPDILTAKMFETPKVHAVEINPLIVEFVRKDFAEFSGNPYELPGVTFTVLDGRSYIAQSEEFYDLIQISEVDTTSAQAAGALTLVENSLYTVEAFEEYYDHLEPEGILSVTRNWTFETQMMALRSADLIRSAWSNRGVEDPGKHLAVVAPRPDSRIPWGTLIASKSPFQKPMLRRLRQTVDAMNMVLLYDPGRRENPEGFEALFGPERETFLREYPYDVAATTDDRPYFFFFLRPFEFLFGESEADLSKGLDWGSKRTPRILVKLFLVLLSLVVIFTFLIPILLGRLRFGALQGAGRGLTYFASIGLGFILVELSFIQRYTLLLGQPLYAFACILGSVLIFSGIGSFLSHRIGDDDVPRRARLILALVVAGALVHAFLAPLLLEPAMAYGLTARIFLTFLTIAPIGLLMGMPLPLGMRMVERDAPRALAWAWGVNGSLSVLGTVLAMVISIFLGITYTLVAGGLMYVLAVVMCSRSRSSAAA